ncbi:hypothetical protein [Pseudomonas sp. PIC25]|uniref:hypothetical protein n=1 Tax=Pseudomonas sp. PIC25 TaxID=1958773 RepID=UPI00117A6E3D|nr:hypothetical protein [Pseudomonas sp. PIC25]
MRTIASESLPRLSNDVKELVSDGVYALFSLRQDVGKYAVVISQDSTAFLLDRDGNVVRVVTGTEYSDLELEEAVTFSRVKNNSIRINAA